MNRPLGQNDRAAWLHGAEHACSHPPEGDRQAWRLVLLGAPGVGKGTQAELLCAKLHACHLSTGDVFRAVRSGAKANASVAMREALNCMLAGKLVPDSTVLGIINERKHCLACRGGFLLDGFPRTQAQAVALEETLRGEGVTLHGVIHYEMALENIVERLTGRRTCPQCTAVFHVSQRPPVVAGVCDHCEGKLVQREDDSEQAVRVRMAIYTQTTAPLLEYYARRGVLLTVSAMGRPEDVFSRTMSALLEKSGSAVAAG